MAAKRVGVETGGVKEWPVSSLIPVVTIGSGYFEIPFVNGGRLPSGGFVRARCAGWGRGNSVVQRSRHSAVASSRAVSRHGAFDGEGWGLARGFCHDNLEALQWD
jgi:hypothetical protein